MILQFPSSVATLIVAGVLLGLYLAYRAVLPKPIPGIPYNKNAASKIFGDAPEMMDYVKRTGRVFVGFPRMR